MAAAEIVINPASVQKLESFLNDSSYREAIENSANFNTRLCIERRLRMPFLDPQTGVAQSHCNLFMNKRQRMPGAREGQIYTYPSQRWRKARRQYLTLKTARWGWMGSMDNSLMPDSSNSLPGLTGEGNDGTSNFGPLSVDAVADTDSRDGSQVAGVSKEDMSKEWFYEELAMEELEALEEPPTPSSDSDYCEEPHPARKRGGRGRGREGAGRPGRRRAEPDAPPPAAAPPTPKTRGAKSPGRGRRKATAPAALPYEVPGDADKPFGCELCGARYKTRPGLTYHYSHSHKEGAQAPTAAPAPEAAQASEPVEPEPTAPAEPTEPTEPHHEYQDSYLTFLSNPGAGGGPSRRSRPATGEAAPEGGAEAGGDVGGDKGSGGEVPPELPVPSAPRAPPSPPTPPAPRAPEPPEPRERERPEPDAEERPRTSSQKASPSPYCDFCLGDQRENKKTGTAEELVSCSDCGRSGHPTCLQFTANMIVSVRKYRWQCIECKCCSVCGTSDNDDQLLFCDDCDRGYHMYCLVPPLTTQPEGSWSCALCIRDFHSK